MSTSSASPRPIEASPVGPNTTSYLRAKILSCYDLPRREPPSYVSLTVAGQTQKSGPPSQRHKDRNSFKFGTNSNNGSSSLLQIAAPLPVLYQATATLEIAYPSQPQHNLVATYKLQELKVRETTWLILNLESKQQNDLSTSQQEELDVPPSLRVQFTLVGPYRTEFATLLHISHTWFGMVDKIEGTYHKAIARMPALPDSKWFLVPAAPLLVTVVVSLPVLLGLLAIFLPMLLPFLLMGSGAILVAVLLGFVLWSSTSAGRAWVGDLLSPIAHTVLSTPSGQAIVYQTGPRPTPDKMARVVVPQNMWGKLCLSLLLDAVGSASYLLPVAGEFLDLGWAPTQTILVMAMYDDIRPNLKYVSFLEEVLPFTDIVPSASIGWLAEFGVPLFFPGKKNGADGGSRLQNVSFASAPTPVRDNRR